MKCIKIPFCKLISYQHQWHCTSVATVVIDTLSAAPQQHFRLIKKGHWSFKYFFSFLYIITRKTRARIILWNRCGFFCFRRKWKRHTHLVGGCWHYISLREKSQIICTQGGTKPINKIVIIVEGWYVSRKFFIFLCKFISVWILKILFSEQTKEVTAWLKDTWTGHARRYGDRELWPAVHGEIFLNHPPDVRQ